MTEYAVKAETHEGVTLMLRRGFLSPEAAEEHPVLMKQWRRVWVEAIEPTIPDHSAPLPWRIVRVRHLTYIADANGKKLASLLGTKERMKYTAAMIIDRCNFTAP